MKVNRYGRNEPAIGEEFEIDGKWYKCYQLARKTWLEMDTVCGTICDMYGQCRKVACIWWNRDDRKEVIYKLIKDKNNDTERISEKGDEHEDAIKQ